MSPEIINRVFNEDIYDSALGDRVETCMDEHAKQLALEVVCKLENEMCTHYHPFIKRGYKNSIELIKQTFDLK